MITPEHLISQLQDQVIKLESELAIAQQDIKDFEKLAIEWKKGYVDMEKSYRVKLANANLIIEELEFELKEARNDQ